MDSRNATPDDSRPAESAPPLTSNRTLRCVWEHSHREFLVALKLLKHAEQRGYTWRTERINRVGAVRRDNECVLVPFYYDDRDINRWLYQLRNRPVRVMNLVYEQMHPVCARDYVIPSGAFAKEELHYTVWGDRFRQLLLEAGIAADKIHVTGHPRFDLYASQEALLSRDTIATHYGLDPNKPWLLFPCNFNFAYVSSTYVERVKARGYKVTPEFIAGFAKARDAFLDMITEVAQACNEVEIVVRVHPAGFEGETLYNRSSARFPHVHIIAEYDIANWISQSAAVVVWNSTSSMEAMVASVPVVSYDPEGFGRRFEYDVNRILPTFTRADEVVELVRALPDPKITYDWDCFESWYRYRDGQNTSRIIDAVDTMGAQPMGGTDGLSRYLQPARMRRFRDALRSTLCSEQVAGRQPFSQSDLAQALRTDNFATIQHVLR